MTPYDGRQLAAYCRRRRPAQIVILFAAPWFYAAFLVFFLFYS